MSEPVSDEYLEILTKAFQDSIEGVIVIGSSVVEVEVDGETNYKVVFELEATEETIQAAQQEEEITRMNNSLVLSVSSTQRRPGLRAASLSPLVLTLFPIWKGEIFINFRKTDLTNRSVITPDPLGLFSRFASVY